MNEMWEEKVRKKRWRWEEAKKGVMKITLQHLLYIKSA